MIWDCVPVVDARVPSLSTVVEAIALPLDAVLATGKVGVVGRSLAICRPRVVEAVVYSG